MEGTTEEDVALLEQLRQVSKELVSYLQEIENDLSTWQEQSEGRDYTDGNKAE